MSDELKMEPCPFCGSDGQIVGSWVPSKTKIFAPQCSGNKLPKYNNGCPALNSEQDEQGGFDCEANTEQEAVELWNARCGEHALRAQLAETKAMVERLVEAGDLLQSGQDTFWASCHPEAGANWNKLADEWKESKK